MTQVFTPPLDDIAAALDAAGLDQILRAPGFEALDRPSVDEALGEFARFVAREIAPLNQIGDKQGSTLGADGRVSAPASFQAAYQAYADAGWPAAAASAESGGG